MKEYKSKNTIRPTQWLGRGTLDPIGVAVNRHFGLTQPCRLCGMPETDHGLILDTTGKNIVCPFDWIIVTEQGVTVMDNDTFQLMYEEV